MRELTEHEAMLIEDAIVRAMERLDTRFPKLNGEQAAALPKLLDWWDEKVRAEKTKREFWERMKLKTMTQAILFLLAFAGLSVVFGGREAMQRLLHHLLQ